jgi:DNA-binding transcriptional LysR family regulator
VLALIRSEDVDLGLTGGDVAFPDIETLFTARDEMSVIYPDSHPIAHTPRITARVLAAYPLVLMDQGTSVRAVTDLAFNRAGVLPTAASEATYMMTAIGMVRAGIGLTILPASAREIVAEPSLRSRKINDKNFSRPVALIKKAHRTLPPLSRVFGEFLMANKRSIFKSRMASS